MQNFDPKKHILKTNYEKNILKISIHNLFCCKFSAVCRNSVSNPDCQSKNCNFLSHLLFLTHSLSLWRPLLIGRQRSNGINREGRGRVEGLSPLLQTKH